jgi:hypothetical protein
VRLHEAQVRRGLELAAALVAFACGHAIAQPTLAALVPAPGQSDARKAIALGPGGEVYEPDATGWVRTQRFAVASKLTVAGRTADGVVASGDGVIYRLAANGWTAIRLAQKGAATMSSGPRAIGAIKRQLYSLERQKGGEAERLALAPAVVVAMAGGPKATVVQTERGLYRAEGTKLTPITGAPKLDRLVSDRWALADRGAYDLRAGKLIAWPAGAKITAATAGPDDDLVAVATLAGKLELLVVRGGKLERSAIAPGEPVGPAVGVAVDRAGRAVVALGDGRMLVRDGSAWTATTVREALPAARPGPAPAVSP